MGFGLSEISRMLDDPDQDLTTGLKRQRERLTERSDRLREVIAALDAAIVTVDQGNTMTDDHVKKAFDGFDPSRYDDEVDDRWGNTDSDTESRRRIGSYTEDDWKRQRQETDDNLTSITGLLRAGVPPTDPRFEAVYEKAETGLARYISDAIGALHAD
jgi:DNA-binding transcriptional MerR regulator